MTNRNNPTGGKAIGSFNAARFDLKVNRYVTSVSDTTPIYRGDAVKTTGTAAVDGTPVCAKALAGESIRGLVVSVEPTHDDENFEYRKASTERIIHVCDDPYIMLEIQTNGTLAITDIGKYANIVLNGGNDITGLSGTMVDLSSTSTDSRQLRIVSLVDRVDNEVGQYAKVRCVIHDHELAHGGSYTQENIWKRVGTTISPYTAGDDIDLGTGDVTIGGKLTVAGLIDPTGLLLDPQAAAPGTDDGMIYYDLPSNTFLFRENGAWHTLDDTGVWKRFTGTPNYLLPLVPADDIGATAARITKGWFTDVEATNMYTVGGTSINANAVLDLTSGEVTQLAKIGATVIALTSWQILGAANQSIATFDSPTFVGATLSGLTTANGIVQTNGSGVLSSSITLPDGTLATTQTPLDNSTKLATTAYVDAAVATVDSWNEVMHLGETFTVLDTENLSATIIQNDTTNNPPALIIVNTGSENDITLPNSSYIKNGLLVLGGDVGLTGTRITKGWFTNLEITNMPTVSGTSINANAVLDLTSAEVTQLANIDTTTISTTQWDFVGAMDQGVGTAINVSFASVTTDNLTMDGNMISSSSGDIQLDPTTNVRINTLTTAGGIVQTSVTGILSSSVTLPDGTLATTQSPADNSTKLATTAYVDAAVVIENLWDRVTGTPNYLLPHTAADDIGATAARITKGWFTNLEITNMPSVNGTSINANAVLDLTSGEVTQLANIGSTTVSAGQWVFLGAMNQGVATTDSPSLTGLTVSGLTTANGIVQTNGSGVLSSSITLPDGTLATTQLPADNSTKLATTAYVDAAVTAEDYWDRDATGTPFILPHNAGDHLHLNDGESTSFATSEFQIFKNSAPDASLWSASATASVDANLNLIRSRGTIASPTAVTDDDLIGNINFIAYSGSAFNNGAEIRAEINGAVSAGVLPCDMVFHVNAGAGTATEGMRLLKTKDLTVVGSVTAASVVVDNLLLDANTLSSTSGNLSLTPVAGSGVIIDSHWSFDANALTSLTDNNTVITAYAGKNVTVENVTFDGGVVAGIIDLTVSFVNITSGAISTTLGNLSLTPVAGSSVIIDSHFGFDGTVLTALTDANTTITAYAGKNITIEGTTFDGGTVAGITSLTIDGVQVIKRTASAVDYNPSVLTTDYLIVITDATAPRAVTISTEDIQSGSTANPRIFVVKDQSGGAGVNSITVSGETGTIDGAASVAIAQNYASLTIYADGTNLFIY